jgi:alkylation response protein AidB-like acyl-CoA dehydrogenase
VRDNLDTGWFMTLVGAVYDGIARAARDHVLDFAEHFFPGGGTASLSSLPRIGDEIGEIELLLEANERLLGSLARDVDARQSVGGSAPVVRFIVIDNAVRAVDLALGIAGNHGLDRAGPLERHYRDVICGRTHAPVGAQVRQTAAARALAAYQAHRTEAAD